MRSALQAAAKGIKRSIRSVLLCHTDRSHFSRSARSMWGRRGREARGWIARNLKEYVVPSYGGLSRILTRSPGPRSGSCQSVSVEAFSCTTASAVSISRHAGSCCVISPENRLLKSAPQTLPLSDILPIFPIPMPHSHSPLAVLPTFARLVLSCRYAMLRGSFRWLQCRVLHLSRRLRAHHLSLACFLHPAPSGSPVLQSWRSLE